MKLLFICGALESGKDGVGDYVHCLCKELANAGSAVAALSVNDHYVCEYSCSLKPYFTRRIPSRWSASRRYSAAKSAIEEFDPEWVSLQFVPYSFQSKGLPIDLLHYLPKVVQKRHLHIMFHEIWVGADGNLRNRISAYLQKRIIARLLNLLQPELIHTSLPINQRRLRELGFIAKGLAIFSNIPTVGLTPHVDREVIRIGFFCHTSDDPRIIDFIDIINKQANSLGKSLEVLVMGRHNRDAELLIDTLTARQPSIKVSSAGFLASEKLSGVIASCSLGVTSVPRHALGKSGTVASFLAHEVPVAAPLVHEASESNEIGFFLPSVASAIMLQPNLTKLAELKSRARKAKLEFQVETIANTFLKDITDSTPKC